MQVAAVVKKHSEIEIACAICGQPYKVKTADMKGKHIIPACSSHFKK